eukprot:9479650-Pyramimonas_sp.AAC.1
MRVEEKWSEGGEGEGEDEVTLALVLLRWARPDMLARRDPHPQERGGNVMPPNRGKGGKEIRGKSSRWRTEDATGN